MRYLVPFGLDGAVNIPEEDEVITLITTVFVEQSVASPGSLRVTKLDRVKLKLKQKFIILQKFINLKEFHTK